jgi:mono/diheme cytochrome c family protein
MTTALFAFAHSVGAEDAPTAKQLYNENCGVCHQTNGGGVPFMQPPLMKSVRANGSKGSVIDMILMGSETPGAGQGEYTNLMPAFDFLTNEEIALIATYVRTHFKNTGGAVSADDVQSRRAQSGN